MALSGLESTVWRLRRPHFRTGGYCSLDLENTGLLAEFRDRPMGQRLCVVYTMIRAIGLLPPGSISTEASERAKSLPAACSEGPR